MTDQTLPVQELIAVLWRRRTLIALVFGAGLLAALVLASLQKPVYRAGAKLMLTSARATIAVSPDADERPRVDPITEADIGSEVALLSSTSLLREVLAPHQDELDAAPKPSGIKAIVLHIIHLPSRIYSAIHATPPPSPLDQWTEDTARNLTVAGIGRSNLIEVAYDSDDPAWAAQLVNELVSHHVSRHIRLNQQTSAQQFFESQRELLASKLQTAEDDLRAFYKRENIDATVTALPALRTRVAKVEAALADAETGLAEATAESNFLEQALKVMPKESATVPILGGVQTSGAALIKTRLVELELQRSQVLSQFAPTSIKVADIDRQIAEAKRLLAQERKSGDATIDPTRQALETNFTQSRARAAALEARVAALRSQLGTYRNGLGHLGNVASEQERLEQEVSAAKQSLSTYLKKEEEARFSNALDESRFVNVSVVEQAIPPETPQPSKRLLTILLGALVSLGAGVGLAFLRDRLDPTIKSAADAERITGLPVLAEVPL